MTTVGAGGDSRQKWNEARNEPTARFQYRQWVFGFVSGYNWHDPSMQIIPPDSSAILGWVDNYCETNPAHALYSAAAMAKQMAKPSQILKAPAKKP